MTAIEYINTPEQLPGLCAKIKQAAWLALDTEFLREKTYYPQFCFLQIATPEWVACVDPLTLTDLNSLFEAIYSPDIIKIFHSCRQDLEIFYQITGKVPQPIFDTQIAAPLLGFQENPGYAMLVSSFLNINLSKAHTRADWSKRPLSEAEVQYAADDVIYLCKIYQIMHEKLNKLGRLDWLNNDFAELANTELYQLSPENAWYRIKGKNKLTGKQLSIVQVLAEWREKTAQTLNRPRNWLLKDEILFDIAKRQPETVAQLAEVRGIGERLVARYGEQLCQLVNLAKDRNPVPYNEKGRPGKLTQQHEAILDIMTALVRIRAEQNSLNPVILATRKDLENLIFNGDDSALLHGWRFQMAGRELVGLLKGELLLGIQSGRLDAVASQVQTAKITSEPEILLHPTGW
ncbi:MAG: ribonuclease D [Methylobacter sp.]|nr:MAG: ribonuclease D [Methylobacter sp.]PPD05270.1 MAG: ribonuclease D [Methylobacter sp.]PPD20606.1 MAG: ribonuclease D [Methylobacter sp.]